MKPNHRTCLKLLNIQLFYHTLHLPAIKLYYYETNLISDRLQYDINIIVLGMFNNY